MARTLALAALLGALAALATGCAGLKPQHQAVGPGDPGPIAVAPAPAEAPEPVERSVVTIYERGKAAGGAGTGAAATAADVGPAATGIVGLLLKASNASSLPIILGAGAWDVGRRAVDAMGRLVVKRAEISTPVYRNHRCATEYRPDGTIIITTEPTEFGARAAPPAPPAAPAPPLDPEAAAFLTERGIRPR